MTRTVRAFIALVEYEDGEKSYILAPDGLKVGDTIISAPDCRHQARQRLPFENIPVGTMIHNIELYPGRGGQLVRSAGVMAQLMAKENGYALVRLPSGEVRNVRLDCMATIGVVGNLDHENVTLVRLAASVTWASVPTVRGCHEPVRSPARRRRRQEPRLVMPAPVPRGASPLWA